MIDPAALEAVALAIGRIAWNTKDAPQKAAEAAIKAYESHAKNMRERTME